jgi:hypothetical protein
MSRIPKFRKSVPDVGLQMAKMQKLFPQLKYYRKNGQMFWLGTFQPSVSSPDYLLKIIYRAKKSPKVYVLNPAIISNAPHRYSDGALCLYYPRDWSWSCENMIAETIVPWAAEWLLCYEFWLETGIWPREEAPHRGEKISD